MYSGGVLCSCLHFASPSHSSCCHIWDVFVCVLKGSPSKAHVVPSILFDWVHSGVWTRWMVGKSGKKSGMWERRVCRWTYFSRMLTHILQQWFPKWSMKKKVDVTSRFQEMLIWMGWESLPLEPVCTCENFICLAAFLQINPIQISDRFSPKVPHSSARTSFRQALFPFCHKLRITNVNPRHLS